MGVIHKLKLEIESFIIEQKKANPVLSCRGLVLLVEEKFEIKVSKSSINSIFKKAGLSMPVGRRPKKKRRKLEIMIQPEVLKSLTAVEAKVEVPTAKEPEKPLEEKPALAPVEEEVEISEELPSERECTGAVLLMAIDHLICGSTYFTEKIKNRLNRQDGNIQAKTEALIYLNLLGLDENLASQSSEFLWPLIGKKFTMENILSYLNELQSDRMLASDMQRAMVKALQEVRFLQLNLAGGNILYLDGQMHTVWSAPHIPYDFSSTICNTKSYINRYFYKNEPFVLFMAPGYDIPTKEFFNFILSLSSHERYVARLTLFGNKSEELESVTIQQGEGRNFVFGLWPWQFVEFRKVKKIGDFKPFFFEALKKELYIAGIEIDLSQPNSSQRVMLKGAALKTTASEKTRLIILSNLPSETTKPDALAKLYLSHWPNLEEGFQDYSRKIELFTYTGTSQRFFSTEELSLGSEPVSDIKGVFKSYLDTLDLYFKWHFLPSGYENKDFPTIKERFYGLKAVLKQEKEFTSVTFQLPQGFAFQKDLEFALRRLNEREAVYTGQSRLWFQI